jgi:hypothetical protein
VILPPRPSVRASSGSLISLSSRISRAFARTTIESFSNSSDVFSHDLFSKEIKRLCSFTVLCQIKGQTNIPLFYGIVLAYVKQLLLKRNSNLSKVSKILYGFVEERENLINM